MVDLIPEELLLLETDSPVLGPTDERNEPANLRPALEHVASIKGIEAEELEEITDKNAERIFKLGR